MVARRDLGQIEEVSPGVWRVRVSAGRDPITGSRQRPRATVKGAKKDAERKLAEMIAGLGRDPGGTTTSLGIYLQTRYLPWKKGEVRANTYYQYEWTLMHRAAPLHAISMDSLSPWSVDQWLSGLSASGLAPRTVNHSYKHLYSALERAVRWRLLPANPLQQVDPPATKRHVPKVLTAEQAVAVLRHFRGHPLELVVNIALGCGPRRSENLGLRWDEYDPDTHAFKVVRGYHGNGVIYEAKNETSERWLYLPPWAVRTIERLHPDGPPSTGWVHTSRVNGSTGKPRNPHNVSRTFQMHVQKIGLTLPFKDLRHSYGTLALESGTDIVVVSQNMGHSQVSTTTGFYVKPHVASKRASAERIGAHLDPDR